MMAEIVTSSVVYPDNFTGRWKAFVTLTDWSGPVMRDCWYGHGKTTRTLIVKYISLRVLCTTLTVLYLYLFRNGPIFSSNLTVQELDRIKQSHGECLEAICQALEPIEFDCEMTSQGRVVMSLPMISIDRVPLPLECHDSIRRTFGENFEKDVLRKPNPETTRKIDLIHFQEMRWEYTTIPIFQVSDLCFVQFRIFEYLFWEEAYWGTSSAMELANTAAMQPGDRERIRLANFACPKHMSSRTRNEVIPNLIKTYQLCLTWPRSVVVWLLSSLMMLGQLSLCVFRVWYLLVPSLVLWLLLPKVDEFRGRRISYYSSTSTLLLLYTLIDEARAELDQIIVTGILAIVALSLNNKRAAFEWAFILLLSSMDLRRQNTWWENVLLVPLHQFDPSGVVISGIIFLISHLIPGDGLLLKLLLLYVIYMSFPSKQRAELIKQD